MKNIKTILCLLLCAALMFSVLAACGQVNEQTGDVTGSATSGANSQTHIDDKTYGRYMEHDITPEGMTGPVANFASFPGGVLDIITYAYVGGSDHFERWRSEDNGETWQQLDMNWRANYGELYKGGEDEISTVNMHPTSGGELLAYIFTQPLSIDAGLSDEEYFAIFEELAETKLVLIDKDGVETPFEPDFMQEAQANGNYLMDINHYGLPGNRFMCVYGDLWGEYDTKCVVGDIESGETIYEVELSSGMNPNDVTAKWNHDTLYLYEPNNGLITLDLETGEACEVPLPNISVQRSISTSKKLFAQLNNSDPKAVCINNEGIFYTLNPEGLRKHEPVSPNAVPVPPASAQGNNPALQGQLIMDGLEYTFGSPLYDIFDMSMNEESGEIYIAANGKDARGQFNEGKIMRYVWDDNAIATSGDVLNVFSLYDNAALRIALAEFKRIRPDVTIEYNTAFDRKPGSQESQAGIQMPVANGITPQMEEEAISTLNTQLLAGEGPDVIFLDDLPFESLVRNGALADITEFIQGSNVMPQLIQPMLIDGKAYAVPTNFTIPVLYGTSDDIPVQSLDALVAAVTAGANLPVYIPLAPDASVEEQFEYMRQTTGPREISEQPFMIPQTLEELFNALYPSSAPAIFPQRSGVDASALESFLQAIKTIYDKYSLINIQEEEMASSQLSISASAIAFAERRARTGYSMLATTTQFTSITSILYWSGEPAPAYDGTMQESSVEIEDLQVAYAQMPGLASGVYVPAQLVGINGIAKQPDVAMLFISTLLSDDLQTNNMGVGLPVTQSGFSIELENYAASLHSGDEMFANIFENPKIVPDTDTLLEMIDALSTPYYANTYLHDTMLNATRQYCEGSLTLPAAVSQVENDTRLYFAERQ